MDSFSNYQSLAWRRLLVGGAIALGGAIGCRSSGNLGPHALADSVQAPPVVDRLVPSNQREWSPDMAILPHAEIDDRRVKVHNIRNCTYRADDEYVVRHYDKSFDLDQIETVDFVVVPFTGAPSLAHTLLSFGFAGGEYVSVSVEARREKGEKYSPVMGAMRQFELMYVVADERDVLLRRTKFRGADVYLYRTRVTKDQARQLFVDMMERVNQLYREPEFYDTVANNCTTNIVRHVNKIRPGRVQLYDFRVLLPGYADQLAYELGLLDETKTFEELREEARINQRANRFAGRQDFSTLIRR